MAGKLGRILRAQQKIGTSPNLAEKQFPLHQLFLDLKKPSERINSSFTTPSNRTLKILVSQELLLTCSVRNKLKYRHWFSKVMCVKHHSPKRTHIQEHSLETNKHQKKKPYKNGRHYYFSDHQLLSSLLSMDSRVSERTGDTFLFLSIVSLAFCTVPGTL